MLKKVFLMLMTFILGNEGFPGSPAREYLTFLKYSPVSEEVYVNGKYLERNDFTYNLLGSPKYLFKYQRESESDDFELLCKQEVGKGLCERFLYHKNKEFKRELLKDEFGRIVEETDYLSENEIPSKVVYKYEYNDSGDLICKKTEYFLNLGSEREIHEKVIMYLHYEDDRIVDTSILSNGNVQEIRYIY